MDHNQEPDHDDFQVLRGIAKSCNTTSWGLGQHLEAEGLRNRDATPTVEAKLSGWAIPYRLDHGKTAWKWSREKILDLVKKKPAPIKGKRRANRP
jgi:hypothetical protein